VRAVGGASSASCSRRHFGAGAGAGTILDHEPKKRSRRTSKRWLPPGSWGIAALFEERWVEDVERALAKANKLTTHAV